MKKFRIWFQYNNYRNNQVAVTYYLTVRANDKEESAVWFGRNFAGRVLLDVQAESEFTDNYVESFTTPNVIYSVACVDPYNAEHVINVEASNKYQALSVASGMMFYGRDWGMPYIKNEPPVLSISPEEPIAPEPITTITTPLVPETIVSENKEQSVKFASPIHRIISEAVRSKKKVEVVPVADLNIIGTIITYDEKEGTILMEADGCYHCVFLNNVIEISIEIDKNLKS